VGLSRSPRKIRRSLCWRKSAKLTCFGRIGKAEGVIGKAEGAIRELVDESRGPSRPLLSQRSRRRCRQRHPQRRRLQPSPRSRLPEDLFARHPTRATPDLHNSASPQTGFLTGNKQAIVEPQPPPLNRRCRIFAKLSKMPVGVRSK